MNALALLLAAFALATHVEYNLGIRTENSDILDWGVLALDSMKPGIVEFNPSELLTPPSSGCLGLQTADGFQCQTRFADIDVNEVKGLLAHISSQGTLTQAQLVSGRRGDVYVEVPHFVPEAQLKRPNPSGTNAKNPATQGNKKKTSNSRAYRKEEDVDEIDDSNKSFLEKYWKYLVPLAIIVAVNNFGPRPESQN